MINRGTAQSSRIVIPQLDHTTDNHILKVINNRVIREKQNIDEVWIYENGKTRNLYKRR